ncbi:hypothetical protein LJC57_02365 [Parabacteroides sp. OttesenSCG-928-G07]|nr:hypothetical protein [Parabacteroides sp. OttesenSCG-928-G21]MDL2277413.1 hypothetical protein [Parabacteroides sp. OttesenSCG-928-G07]
MKQTFYIIALCCAALFFGCNGEEDMPIPAKPSEKVRVKLSGSLQTTGIITRANDEEEYEDPGGMIDPIDSDGTPPYQLKIGIVTIEFGSYEDSIPPTIAQWDDPTTYLDYGFFGGQIPDDSPDKYGEHDDPGWTGNIEYTNRAGDAIQNVFYDEMGIYYYMVAFYPYHSIYNIEDVEEDRENNKTIIWDEEGATVVFEVDGSQDIMATGMGGGNIEHPFTDSLTFSHKLTSLRCHFVAESALAKSLYGNITSVELIEQPLRIGLNIGKQANGGDDAKNSLTNAYPELTTDYPAVRRDSNGDPITAPLPLPSTYAATDAVEFGYVLAMPAQTYTFRIMTAIREEKNPLYVTYTFPPNLPLAGTVYNLTFKLLETAEILLDVAPAEEWSFDQNFD